MQYLEKYYDDMGTVTFNNITKSSLIVTIQSKFHDVYPPFAQRIGYVDGVPQRFSTKLLNHSP